eukprot:gene12318-8811_t
MTVLVLRHQRGQIRIGHPWVIAGVVYCARVATACDVVGQVFRHRYDGELVSGDHRVCPEAPHLDTSGGVSFRKEADAAFCARHNGVRGDRGRRLHVVSEAASEIATHVELPVEELLGVLVCPHPAFDGLYHALGDGNMELLRSCSESRLELLRSEPEVLEQSSSESR